MPIFDYRFTVAAPLAAVQGFHRDTSALKRLTPPPTIVQLHSIEPLAEGSTSKFTLWVGPLPLRWTAVHRDVSSHGFTDVQADGPARKWEHTHTFVAISEAITEIREHIEYEHNSGFWGVRNASTVRKAELVLHVYLSQACYALVLTSQLEQSVRVLYLKTQRMKMKYGHSKP